MSTINEQLQKLSLQIANNLALINALREQGWLYVFLGDGVKYGCEVTKVDAQTAKFCDTTNKNPNMITPALRPEEYANTALVYGEVYFSDYPESSPLTISLDAGDNPGAGFIRSDLVYIYVADSGPNVSVLQGAVIASPGPAVDPVLPAGTLVVARMNMTESGLDTVDDLRTFF